MKAFNLSLFAAPLAALLLASPALASASYSGTVMGSFESPVLAGNIVNTDGSLLYLDNSTTADYGISANGDTISWGHSTTGASPGFSFLYFVGADFTNVAPDTPFKLGTIQYLNGTSDLDTLIFGVTLNLDLGSGIDIKLVPSDIVTTANTGLSAARDADFVTFGSDIPLTFNVYESGNAKADLYGMIVGDPTVSLTNLQITPGFERQGFVGKGVGNVPEPESWALLVAGFAAMGAALRQRRRTILNLPA